MKILIVVNALKFGGAEKQAIIDANSLVNQGHQVTIAFNKKGELEKLLSRDIKRYQIKNKNVIFASVQLLYHLWFNKYNIIHCHMFWAEKVSVLPGKLTNHKLVFNEHGLGLWRKWYHILIIRFISIFADKIITSCEATKKVRIEREKINRNKLITIYNSFDNIGEKHSNVTLPDFLKNKKEFIISFIGRFNPVKRLRIFIEIAEQLKKKIPRFRIVLVGDGEEKKKVKEEVKKRGLSRYFYMPGFILNPAPYYKVSDVFVLPSIREAFSIALLEAGASGIPAIAFNVGGNSEIIKDNITGFLISDRDISLLIEKIVFLYQNSEKKENMGKAAREYIKNTFSVKNRINNLEKLYRDII